MIKVIQPRVFHPRKALVVGSVILGLIIFNALRYPPPRNLQWQGQTMGTYFTVKLPQSRLTAAELHVITQQIAGCLEQLNAAMSTYRPDSEISRFNAQQSTDSLRISTSFAAVVACALDIGQQTKGALDITIQPLLEAWGFGPEPGSQPPSDTELARLRTITGYEKITFTPPDMLAKAHPDMQLDVNALAKGYAVDRVTAVLKYHGIDNSYVDIGGDVYTSGLNNRDTAWQIGIEKPLPSTVPGDALWGVIRVSDQAVATSGNYRNFHKTAEGSWAAHILDPATMHPVIRSASGVTVIAPTCMEADAAATALYVMGPEKGLSWINGKPGWEALFLTSLPDGLFESAPSSGFTGLLSP